MSENKNYNVFVVDHINNYQKEMIYNLNNNNMKGKKNKTTIRDRGIYLILDDLRVRLILNNIDNSDDITYNIIVEYNDIVIFHKEYLEFYTKYPENRFFTKNIHDVIFYSYEDKTLEYALDRINIDELKDFKNKVLLEINKEKSSFYGYNANSIIFPEYENDNLDKITQDEKDEFIDYMKDQELDQHIIDYIDTNLKTFN